MREMVGPIRTKLIDPATLEIELTTNRTTNRRNGTSWTTALSSTDCTCIWVMDTLLGEVLVRFKVAERGGSTPGSRRAGLRMEAVRDPLRLRPPTIRWAEKETMIGRRRYVWLVGLRSFSAGDQGASCD